MKIWIGLCLTWLIVRVVSAGPINNIIEIPSGVRVFETAGKSLIEKSYVDYGSILKSLDHVRRHKPTYETDHANKSARLVSLINEFTHYEEFLRGALPLEILAVPKSHIPLRGKDHKVYSLLARELIYPELKNLRILIQEFRRMQGSQRYLISSSDNQRVRESCFSKKEFTSECYLIGMMESRFTVLLDRSELTKAQGWQEEEIKSALLRLLKRPLSSSVYDKKIFIQEAAKSWLQELDSEQQLVDCLSSKRKFETFELLSTERCQRVLVEDLAQENMDSEVKTEVFKQVFHQHSRLNRLVVSLAESVLNRGVLCFSSEDYDCLYDKISERLGEWSQARFFTPGELHQLAHNIALNWID